VLIVARFPPAPDHVVIALSDLDRALNGSAEQKADAGDLRALQRPWEPDTCGTLLRSSVWTWCLEVAAWVNHEYGWRPEHMIPPCWPLHPHIARELPVLAVLRWIAHNSAEPVKLEEWHRDRLPGFLTRMADRLGDSCGNGAHQDWPAAGRYDAYTGVQATDAVERIIATDARTWDTQHDA